MNILNFKSDKNLMAVKTSNSFGDQIIAVIDVSQDRGNQKDRDFLTYAGRIIFKNVEHEGNWIEFTEEKIIGLMKNGGVTKR